jgi:hypothetical protein
VEVAFLLFRDLLSQKIVFRSWRTRSKRSEWRGRPSVGGISSLFRHLPPAEHDSLYLSGVCSGSPTRNRFQAVKLCSQLVCRTAHDWLPGRFPGTDPSLAKMIRDGNLITRKRSGLLHGTYCRQTLNSAFGLREVWPFNFFDFLDLTVFIYSNGEAEGYGVGRKSFQAVTTVLLEQYVIQMSAGKSGDRLDGS